MALATWESWYRQLKPQSVNYTRSIVSYLDILGFRELVETKKPGEISRILRILGESIKPHPDDEPIDISFTRFSDTIIRSIPSISPAFFIYELKTILRAQVALVPKGVAIRGAVTVGDIVQSWGVVYGPAVVRAYELESPKGGPPRITIDDKALSLLRPAINEEVLLSLGLVKREKSIIYLDYLKACEVELNHGEYSSFLALHRDFIRQCLTKYAENPRVLGKYEWLRDYHERTLLERFENTIPLHLHV
jgi:hypothetical protein